MRTASALCAIALAMSANAGIVEDIQGTWQLVEVVVPTLEDSNPRGIPAVKEHYSADGRLCFIGPSAAMDANTLCANYRIEGNQRTVRLDNHPPYVATLTFASPDSFVVSQAGGDTWRYSRLKGDDAANRKIEPISVEVLKSREASAAVEYDTHDYSALPGDQRLTGVWEVIAHGNVDRHEAPPYGYLNDVWIFDGSKVSTIVRAQSRTAPPPERNYSVRGDTITIDGESATSFAFNSWGHLTLDFKGHTVKLKLVSKRTSGEPALPPLKIALLHLRGEPSDP